MGLILLNIMVCNPCTLKKKAQEFNLHIITILSSHGVHCLIAHQHIREKGHTTNKK